MDLTSRTLACVFLLAAAASAQVLFVDEQAAGNQSGLNWTDAFTDLQQALSVAGVGTEIWVAGGHYRPGNPTAGAGSTFPIPSGVALYGGFAGTETARAQRDPTLNPTILDGDLKGDDILGRIADNVTTVVTMVNASPATVLDGFVVRGARGGQNGGGLLVSGGSPTLAQCVFEDNQVAQHGGGALIDGASLTVTGCVFSFNKAATGGGLYLSAQGGTVNVTLDTCSFVGNDAVQATSLDGDGGGLFAEAGVILTVTHGLFQSNRALPTVPLTISTGGGLATMGSSLTVLHSLFEGNFANLGGGIYCAGTLLGSHIAGSGNHVVDVNNLPGGRGGAVWAQNATLEGCTLAGNYAEKQGGAAIILSGTVRNSIVWGNTIAPLAPGETPPAPIEVQIGGGPNILYSDVQGLLTAAPGENPPNPANFPGSLEQDPLFVDGTAFNLFPSGTALRNLRLAAGSPCIDAADNAGFAIPGPAGDFNGKPRFYDTPASPNTGLGTGPLADMGAFEHGPWLNDLPLASFTRSLAVLTVSATDTSTSINGPMRLEIWDFGDGTGSCVPHPTHHYSTNGPKNLRLRVFDVARAAALAVPQIVAPLDTQGPSVAFVQPLPGAGVTGTITVVATASDNDVVSQVSFAYNNTSLGTDLEAPYSATWDTTLVPDGFYTLVATALDAVGNSGFTTETVHVVNGAPVMDCLPAPIDLRVQLGDTLVATFHATGILPMTYILLNGPPAMQVSSGSSGTITWTPAPADLGTHLFSVQASNPSGTDSSPNLTIEVIPRVYLVESFDQPGYTSTTLTGLNDSGQMTGFSELSANGVHGFIWDGSQFTQLQATGWMWTFANDINNNGLVTGSVFGIPLFQSAVWKVFTWQNGVFNIGLPFSNGSPNELDSNSVNDAGILVGTAFPGAYGHTSAWTTFLGPAVTIQPPAIQNIGNASLTAGGINNLGQVIGSFSEAPPHVIPIQIYVFDDPTQSYQTYTIPGVGSVWGQGINDAGFVCGTYRTCTFAGQDQAFIATAPNPGPGDWLEIRLPGASTIHARDINNSGVVVGDYVGNGTHGFIARRAASFKHPDLGFAGPGNAHLQVTGYLGSGNQATLELSGAAANSSAWLLVSTQMNPTLLLGGTVIPFPVELLLPFITSSAGNITLAPILGGGGPFTVYAQFVYSDANVPGGFGISNAVQVSWAP